MLTLRLQRAGKKNKPEFRIILAESTAAANKKFIEILGNYNPRTKEFAVKDEARLKYWVEQHVSISPTLNNLLISKNLLQADKKRAFLIPTKVRAKKAEEEAKAKADAEAAAAAPVESVSEEVAETAEPLPVETEVATETTSSEPENSPEVAVEEEAKSEQA